MTTRGWCAATAALTAVALLTARITYRVATHRDVCDGYRRICR